MSNHEKAMLDDLLDVKDELNEWEQGFVKSIDKLRNTELSMKQRDKLHQIWDKIIEGDSGGQDEGD